MMSLRRLLPTWTHAPLRRWRDRARLPRVATRFADGGRRAARWSAPDLVDRVEGGDDNPLAAYFAAHREGPGIWKWEHYFEIYHRHLERFRAREVSVLEIGIYSGGSLDMWREYFGPACRVTGIDIEPACRAYERPGVRIVIGDQGSDAFWDDFLARGERYDVLIDDGGHTPEQQLTTLRRVLPALAPGGVYLCEDVHGTRHAFTAEVAGLADALNAFDVTGPATVAPSAFQASIHSVHFYPFVAVIEKRSAAPARLHAPRRGTEWQPFFDEAVPGGRE